MTGEDLFEVLEEVASEKEKVTDELLGKLAAIEERLIAIIEKHGLTDDLCVYDCSGYGFRLKGTEKVEYIHLCSLRGGAILPGKAADVGRSFYYQGDYNYPEEYMSRIEVLSLCEVLRDFVKNMISKIEMLRDEERKFLEKLLKC